MVELPLSSIPHSSRFVWSGFIPMVEPGAAGVSHSVLNDTTKDRVLFYIGLGNTEGTVTAYIGMSDSATPGLTGYSWQKRNYGAIITTEGQTSIASASGAFNSSTTGTWYNGLLTGNVMLWPAGWYLHVTCVAATARTHVLQYGYWERPLTGVEQIG